MIVDRSVVQAILAVVVIVGVLFLIARTEDRLPLEALFGLAGWVLGFYFGRSNSSSDQPPQRREDS